jgi:hypothetical protein
MTDSFVRIMDGVSAQNYAKDLHLAALNCDGTELKPDPKSLYLTLEATC